MSNQLDPKQVRDIVQVVGFEIAKILVAFFALLSLLLISMVAYFS